MLQVRNTQPHQINLCDNSQNQNLKYLKIGQIISSHNINNN